MGNVRLHSLGQSQWKGNQANSWPVGPNAARHGKALNGVRPIYQGCALRWANCWAFGPNDFPPFCAEQIAPRVPPAKHANSSDFAQASPTPVSPYCLCPRRAVVCLATRLKGNSCRCLIRWILSQNAYSVRTSCAAGERTTAFLSAVRTHFARFLTAFLQFASHNVASVACSLLTILLTTKVPNT